MLRTKIKTLVIFLLLSVFAMVGHAGVYKCKNAAGNTTFQDRPCLKKPGDIENDANKNGLAANDSGKHFFWKAVSGDNTVYLLGSVHVGSSEMYPLAPVITQAFETTDFLVVEVDISDNQQMDIATKMLQTSQYTDGSTLQDHISVDTWNLLAKTLKRRNMDIEAVKVQKPWAITLMLMGLTIQESGFSPKLGVDHYFITGARGKKNIVELESADSQMNLLRSFPESDQEKFLTQTLNSFDQGPQIFRNMLSAWQTGDTKKLHQLTTQGIDSDPSYKRIYDELFTKRNHSMMQKIDQLVQTGGRYFVIVGSGHMTGPDGIVALLKTKGYEVTQL